MAEIISRPKVRLATQEDENGDRYFIDTTTRNLSFLQTSADLSRLGIKNNKFFLALYDRVLQGVDPFSPSLSNELKQRIGLECWNNMWYFLRECVRIPSQGGATGPGAGDPFILHRANLAAAWCFHRCQDFYLVIPRQCFKTFSVLAMFLWAYLFGTSNTTFNFVSKSQPDADANLDKLKQEKEILPLFLQHKYRIETVEVGLSKEEKQIFGTNNVRRIRNPITNNTIDAKPSARTEAAADALGRGNSAPMQYYDEVEFTPFIGTILQASGPAYYQAAMNSKRNNAIYCRVITSTPGSLDSQPVIDMNKYRERMGTWTEHIYDMAPDVQETYIKKECINQIMYIEYSYKQIGRDENWFQGMCAIENYDKMKIKREVLLQRIRGSTNSPFDPEDLDAINAKRPDSPMEEHTIMDYFIFKIYVKLDKDTPYLMGVDCATGTNEDATSIIIVDPYDLRAVANLKTPLATPVETAQLVAEIHQRFVPKAVICIERNHVGDGIIALLRQTNMTRWIYNNPDKMFVPDNVDHLDKHQKLVYEAENRKYWGVYTQGQNREIMMASLLLAVQRNKERFICIDLVNELNHLIRKSSGKIEAESGYHDDVVMSYCLAVLVYEQGVRLHRWGIMKGMSREVVEMVQHKEPTYEEIYGALPENLRSIFPNPNRSTMQVSPEYVGTTEELDGRKKANLDDEILRRARDSRAKTQRIRIDSENNIVVDDDYVKEMIEAAARNKGSGNFSEAQFDIADMFNE